MLSIATAAFLMQCEPRYGIWPNVLSFSRRFDFVVRWTFCEKLIALAITATLSDWLLPYVHYCFSITICSEIRNNVINFVREVVICFRAVNGLFVRPFAAFLLHVRTTEISEERCVWLCRCPCPCVSVSVLTRKPS